MYSFKDIKDLGRQIKNLWGVPHIKSLVLAVRWLEKSSRLYPSGYMDIDEWTVAQEIGLQVTFYRYRYDDENHYDCVVALPVNLKYNIGG